MSTESLSTLIIKWLEDRAAIRLEPKYFKEWYNRWGADPSNNPHDLQAVYDASHLNFLNQNILKTSRSVIPEDHGKQLFMAFPPTSLRSTGVVLQIMDTVDISHSINSLLSCISKDGRSRRYKTPEDNTTIDFPRGTLRWVLSDGKTQITAIEIQKIPNLNLKTPFGCKICIKNCNVSNGILFLTPNNTKVLGGKVPMLYSGNMMVELERRLKKRVGKLEMEGSMDSFIQNTFNDDLESVHPSPQSTETPLFLHNTPREDEAKSSFEDQNRLEIIDSAKIRSSIPYRATTPCSDDNVCQAESTEYTNPSRTSSALHHSRSLQVDTIYPQNHLKSHSSSASKENLLVSQANLPIESQEGGSPLSISTQKKLSLKRRSQYQLSDQDTKKSTPYVSPYFFTQSHQDSNQESEAEDESLPDDTSKWMEDNLVIIIEDNPVEIKKEKDDHTLDEPINSCRRLHQLLLRLKNSEKANHPDQVLLECKSSKLGKMRVNTISGYYQIVYLVDPDSKDMTEDVAVVFGDKFITELTGKPYSKVYELDKNDKSKNELRRVIKMCHSKLLKTQALVKLDLTLMETSEDGIPMPKVIEYTPC